MYRFTYLLLILIGFGCSESESPKVDSEISKESDEWVYPTGNRRLILDSWLFKEITYDESLSAELSGFVDSLQRSALSISIRDKGKFVWAAKPKIQRWGSYEVDSNYTHLTVKIHGPEEELSFGIVQLSEDELKLSQEVDSLNTLITWTFKSMGNKF